MLPTSTGVESATSWSPVGWHIQLRHRGRLITLSIWTDRPEQIYHRRYISWHAPNKDSNQHAQADESSLAAPRNSAFLVIQSASSDDSDWTAQMCRLIWIFATGTSKGKLQHICCRSMSKLFDFNENIVGTHLKHLNEALKWVPTMCIFEETKEKYTLLLKKKEVPYLEPRMLPSRLPFNVTYIISSKVWLLFPSKDLQCCRFSNSIGPY